MLHVFDKLIFINFKNIFIGDHYIVADLFDVKNLAKIVAKLFVFLM